MRLPISVEAWSDCSRRRLISSVSARGANVGELKLLDISVGGVDDREPGDIDEMEED